MSSTCVFDLSLTAFACLHQSLSVFTILVLWLYLCPYLCLYLSLPALPAFKTFYLRSPDLPLHTYTCLYPPLPAFTCLCLGLSVFTITAGARAHVQYSVSALCCSNVALSSLQLTPAERQKAEQELVRLSVETANGCMHCRQN